MPFYKVTLAENVRHYHKHTPIEAATPEEAVGRAREKDEWTQTTIGDDSDANEPTFIVDECDEDGWVMPDGKCSELEYPGYVYKSDLERFAKKVAGLGEEGAYDDVIETLDEMIREARAMLGIADLAPEQARRRCSGLIGLQSAPIGRAPAGQ